MEIHLYSTLAYIKEEGKECNQAKLQTTNKAVNIYV